MLNKLTKQEWVFIGCVWIVAAIIAFFPLILTYIRTPSDSEFLFRPANSGADYTVYFSWIEQAKEGHYLFTDFFTSELQPVGMLSPFYLSLGIIARVFSLPGPLVLQLATLLLGLPLLWTLYQLAAFFFEEARKRKICFALLVFGSGIGGWLATIFTWYQPKDYYYPSLDLWEAFTLPTLANPPHFIASLALVLIIILCSFYFFETHKFRYSFLAGICSLFLLSFHPYHVYTLIFVPLVFTIIECVRARKLVFRSIWHYAIVMGFSAVPMLYHVWVFATMPVRYGTSLLNITLSPPAWLVVVDYSVLMILALIGMFSILLSWPHKRKEIFLIAWAFTHFLLLYFPVHTQRRLFTGFNIPVLLLASYGLFFLGEWIMSLPWAKKYMGMLPFFQNSDFLLIGNTMKVIFLIAIFIPIFGMSQIVILMFKINIIGLTADSYISNNMEYYYLPYIKKDNLQAMEWLRHNTPQGSILLSGYANGNLIPAIAYRPVYIGHWGETVKFGEKMQQVHHFFNGSTPQERKSFLENNNIKYIFWGPEEKILCNGYEPAKDKFLQSVYKNNSVAIFKVSNE